MMMLLIPYVKPTLDQYQHDYFCHDSWMIPSMCISSCMPPLPLLSDCRCLAAAAAAAPDHGPSKQRVIQWVGDPPPSSVPPTLKLLPGGLIRPKAD
jgi:hypothetical protein